MICAMKQIQRYGRYFAQSQIDRQKRLAFIGLSKMSPLGWYGKQRKMTTEELRNILIRTQLTQGDLAKIADVSDRQVYSWLNGVYKIPQPVALIMKALDRGEISIDWVVNNVGDE